MKISIWYSLSVHTDNFLLFLSYLKTSKPQKHKNTNLSVRHHGNMQHTICLHWGKLSQSWVGLNIVDVPLVEATDKSLVGYWAIVHDPEDFTVAKRTFEIVPWPTQRWRKLDPGTGDEAGTTENLAVSTYLSHLLGWSWDNTWAGKPYRIYWDWRWDTSMDVRLPSWRGTTLLDQQEDSICCLFVCFKITSHLFKLMETCLRHILSSFSQVRNSWLIKPGIIA